MPPILRKWLSDSPEWWLITYDLHDVADTKVMSEFLHREGGRYWTTIDGVRQLYRRIECKMCFEVIEKLKKL